MFRRLFPTVIQIRRISQATPEIYRELPPFESHSDSLKVVPVFKKASIYLERTALKDQYGKYSYYSLVKGTQAVEQLISNALSGKTGERVVFLCPNNAYYVLVQWGIWMSGQIAVPLSHLHPPEMMEYYIQDSKANLIITTPKFAEIMDQVARKTQKRLLVLDDSYRRNALSTEVPITGIPTLDTNLGQPDQFYENNTNALIIYTSGTTGPPKGVVLTHRNLQSQILALLKAWQWSHNDSILHTLPLHHIHGIVNVLMCPLYVGAKCTMLPKFDVQDVWSQLIGINVRPEDRINMYMAVPTIYVKLIQEYDKIFQDNPKMVEYVFESMKSKIRLMVSGSAALPQPIFNRWLEISGHKLLERYGMTETGMSISNVFDDKSIGITYKAENISQDQIVSKVCSMDIMKPAVREPGYVGLPLPGVSTRLAEKLHHNKYRTILECSGGTIAEPKVTFTQMVEEPISDSKEEHPTGEILIKGDSVFKEYFNKPTETALEFTEDGWFRTGDIGLYDTNLKLFKILGRSSVDIIKSGGYKISALQIETAILEHPMVQECAVVALPDLMFGEKVAAIVVTKDPVTMKTIPDLNDWNKTRLAEYSVPKLIRYVEELPRNVMGKVNKKDLVKAVFGDVLEAVKARNLENAKKV